MAGYEMQCGKLGGLPLPVWGEGWGEGVTRDRELETPHPTPLPMGEGADRVCGVIMHAQTEMI